MEGSPEYCPSIGRRITPGRRDFTPTNKLRDGRRDSASLLFVDDAISIDPRVGFRPEVCVSRWGHLFRKLIGGDSINQDNPTGEGEWKHILLGYEVNADAPTVRLHGANVCGAWEVLHDPAFKPGNRITPVKNAQVWRGLVSHWVGANRFWENMDAPFNALLVCADETNTRIRCENDQIWIAVWNMMKFARWCARDTVMWNKLFVGSMLDLLPLPRRLSFPEPDVQILWATGDSGLGRFAATNWTTMEYVVEDAMEFLNEIIRRIDN